METGKKPDRFSVNPETWLDEPVIVLQDYQSGSKAIIAPGVGNNCVFWSVKYKGQELPILDPPESFAFLKAHPARAGVPVLWPFPGRVRNGRFTFEGEHYQMPRNDKEGINHLHGMVISAPWEAVGMEISAEGASVLSRIGPENITAEMRQGYPFKFELSLRLTLKDYLLKFEINLENKETARAIPFGFGLHPYFKIPLVATPEVPDRGDCSLRIGVEKRWPTEGGIPAGPAVPPEPGRDFKAWQVLGHQLFDDMYTGAIFKDGWTSAGFRNGEGQVEVEIRADQHFQDWVLFTPPSRQAVAIEPYTCAPNAINFAGEGLSGGHIISLGAGETWKSTVILEVK